MHILSSLLTFFEGMKVQDVTITFGTRFIYHRMFIVFSFRENVFLCTWVKREFKWETLVGSYIAWNTVSNLTVSCPRMTQNLLTTLFTRFSMKPKAANMFQERYLLIWSQQLLVSLCPYCPCSTQDWKNGFFVPIEE